MTSLSVILIWLKRANVNPEEFEEDYSGKWCQAWVIVPGLGDKILKNKISPIGTHDGMIWEALETRLATGSHPWHREGL